MANNDDIFSASFLIGLICSQLDLHVTCFEYSILSSQDE